MEQTYIGGDDITRLYTHVIQGGADGACADGASIATCHSHWCHVSDYIALVPCHKRVPTDNCVHVRIANQHRI